MEVRKGMILEDTAEYHYDDEEDCWCIVRVTNTKVKKPKGVVSDTVDSDFFRARILDSTNEEDIGKLRILYKKYPHWKDVTKEHTKLWKVLNNG